jgi:hypothetical protein
MNFELEGGGSKTAMANGVFTRGLYKPILREPRLDTVFLNQNRIRFRFKTSDTIPPVAGQFGLLPSAEVIKAVKGNTPNLFKAEVLERYRLEVAADANFDSIVVRHSDMLRVE